MNISQRGHDIQHPRSGSSNLRGRRQGQRDQGLSPQHRGSRHSRPGPVMDVFHNWSQPVLGYGPAQGFLELREAVTRYFAKYDISLGRTRSSSRRADRRPSTSPSP